MPECEAGGDCHRAEEPELPAVRAVSQDVAAVADSIEGPDTEVKAVCDQAESGEEPNDERPGHSNSSREKPESEWQ